jgi:hypothetical protein
MTELIWNNTGERYFEAGVDRGVFYASDGKGVAWNGLISVKESPSGGEPTPYYMDGVKYLNIAGRKEFVGSIEAYTYPEEFSEYDGWVDLNNGLVVDEQQRKAFGLSYRTLIGNDIDSTDHGYKIHIVYNVLAAPTEREYSTMGDQDDPLTFNWDFTTTPGKPDPTLNLAPWAHFIIDSRKTNPTQMRFIEGYLYGTASREPQLPTLEQMYILFENPLATYRIQYDSVTGLSYLIESDTVNGDLRGRITNGLYVLGDYTHLNETFTAGLNTLEP